ncbi:MAG: hypothetical protein WBW04_14775 [Nitrolancea sp.]
MPLLEAVRRDSTLRPSEFGWVKESQWGSRPPLRAPIGTRRIADQVVGQLKRPSRGALGAFSQVAGVIIGITVAFFGIPLFITGLLLLTAKSVFLLPIFLAVWIAAVVLLLVWGIRSRAMPSPYRRAMVRLADLSYCPDCHTIYDMQSARVVPIDRLHEGLYSNGLAEEAGNRLSHR